MLTGLASIAALFIRSLTRSMKLGVVHRDVPLLRSDDADPGVYERNSVRGEWTIAARVAHVGFNGGGYASR